MVRASVIPSLCLASASLLNGVLANAQAPVKIDVGNSIKDHDKYKAWAKPKHKGDTARGGDFDQIAYDIIFDCGSTGSRMYVFSKKFWTEEHIWSDVVGKKKPGLSSFVGKDETAVGEKYQFLFDKFFTRYGDTLSKGVANGTVSKDISVNFFGTAGMRLLPDGDQDTLWTAVRKSMGVYFKMMADKKGINFKLGDAKTIPGEEEGYYAILGVNYLTQIGNVDDYVRKSSGWALDASKVKKYGILDLGGSSTQIALPKASAAPNAQITTDNTVVHSFLSMGMELAREAVINKFSEIERAPCFFQDRSEAETKAYMSGEYQWGSYACMKLIKEAMQERWKKAADEGKHEEHPLNLQQDWHDFGVSQSHFVAVSGYLYVTDFALHILTKYSEVSSGAASWFPKLQLERYVDAYKATYPKPNIEALMGSAEALCALPLSIIKEMHEKVRHSFTGSSKLLDRCFEINYVATLLQMYTVGYHNDIPFDKDAREQKEKDQAKSLEGKGDLSQAEQHADLFEGHGNVWFTDEIAGSEVEWPIGKWLDDHDQSQFIADKKNDMAGLQFAEEQPSKEQIVDEDAPKKAEL